MSRCKLALLAAIAGTLVPAAALAQQYTSSPNLPIPVEPGPSVEDVITVTGGPASIVGLACTVNITYAWDGDLEIILTRGDPTLPSSTYLILSTNNGDDGEDYTNTRFIDGAPSITAGNAPFTGDFRPEGGTAGLNGWDSATIPMNGTQINALAGFVGMNANTDWHLCLDDIIEVDAGTLLNWTLDFGVGPPPPPPPPPANDLCTAATPVIEGVHPFNNENATDDGTSSCGFNGSPGYHSVWFDYTPSITGNAVISVCGLTGLDTQLTAHDAPCGAELGCGEDECDLQSRVVIGVTAGRHVWMRVASWEAGDFGSGSVEITASVPPANDNCADAALLASGVPAPFNTVGANTDGSGTCGFATASDVWYKYVQTNTGGLRVSLCGSDFDTVVSAFDGCNGTELGCNDDACGLQSELSLCSRPAGSTTWFRVSGYDGEVGSGTITATEFTATPFALPPGCTAEGEDCAQINPDNYNGGCNSTPEAFQLVSLCTAYCATGAQDGTGFRDTDWFTFNVPASGTLTVTGQSQFAAQWYLISVPINCLDPGSSIIAGPVLSDACGGDMTISATLTGAESVVFFASPANFQGDSTCGVNENYHFAGVVDAAPCGAGCDPDFNCDGNPDQDDVACMINVVAGNPGCECQDPDFNQDGNVDQEDVAALINVVAGGDCP